MTSNGSIRPELRNIDYFGSRGYDEGWSDVWCYPQIYMYLLPHLKPKDKVLDVGFGTGRSSFPFAIHGADVYCIEPNDEWIAEAAYTYARAGLNFNLVSMKDALSYLKDSEDIYEFVILSEILTHCLRSEAVQIVDASINHCGKYFFVTVPSVLSPSFQYHQTDNYGEPEPLSFLEECCCSGQPKIEPISYYFPGEIESIIVARGGKIIAAEQHQNSQGGVAWVIVAEFN